MDKIYTDPNMENDNTEPIRRKRPSSILKAPRNPLDDLGNGNEMTQDIHVERRRRSSRRVSFANTINCRVFQRDLKNNTSETENTGCSPDEKDDTLTNQNEDPGAVPCEITGMNTLLHAPIQALGQQAEWHDVDQGAARTDRQDTTLLFSEENEMEMTASHTALISRDLRAPQPDGTEKIDFTSFLAKLNSSQGKAETSKELSLLSDPTNHPGPSLEQKEEATAVKKIDFNEFLLRLKSDNPAERPDRDNVCCVPSQGLGDVTVTRLSGEFGYSHEALDTCNVTKVFRGREGGMDMTKCEAADVKIPFPGVSEVPAEQWECVDVTEAFADEGMDVTTSHTAKVSFALSTVENQSLKFQKDFPPRELDNPVFRRASSHDSNVQQDPQLCADRKPGNAEGRGDPAVLRAGKQEARALSAIQGSVSSETIFRGDRTVVLSKCDDMDMTGNYTDIIYEASTTEKDSSCHKTCEKPVGTNALLSGSRSLACGDISSSLAPGDNPAAGPCKISAMELPSASGGHMENVSQAHGPAASTGFGSYVHSVAGSVLKSRFEPSANPQLVFPGEKTVIFTGEDMDLAKTFVKGGGENVDDEHPTAAFPSVTCKPHFLGNRSMPSNVPEQEEMEITRCHTVFFDGQSSGITAEPKQTPCKIMPRKSQNKNVTEADMSAYSVDMDKENVEVRSIDGNIKKNQVMERNAQDVRMIMVDKKLGKTNFQASGLSSCAKSMCLSQEQIRGENVVTNTSASLSLQSQEVVSQPLGKNLPSLSDFCPNDTTGVFLGDQSMDITKAHPAAFEIAPIDTEQESSGYNQNTALSKQLQNQPFPFSTRGGVDVRSQTAAMECGDLKMNTNKQIVTALAPSGPFTFSDNPAPSGMRGNEQFGTMIGINADGQNSDRQEKPQPVRAVSKILPTQGDSDRHFSMGKTDCLREDLKPPPSAHGLLQRGLEEPAWARTSEAAKGSSQLSFFGEKSVVFPHGENMDVTGRCVVMVPDYSINVVVSEDKAAPGCFGQGGKERMEQGATTAELGGWEAAAGRTISFAPAEDMEITTTHPAQHRQPLPARAADKTIVFAHDQEDMDITASHTVAVSKNIHGFEAQQVPHTNSQQPPQHLHSGLVPCSAEMDSSQDATKPKDKPSIPSSASSDSAFPSEKGATQVPSGTAPHSIYSASLQDVGTPQDRGLPTGNCGPVSREQDLTPPEKLQSKGVSSEFPSKGTVDHSGESGSVGSCVAFPVQGSDPWKGHPDAPSTQRNQLVEEDSSQCGVSDLGLAGTNLIPAANKESKKNEELPAEGDPKDPKDLENPKDFQKNSEKNGQLLVSDSSGDQAHPTLLPAASGVLGVCSKLIDLTKKSVSVSKTASSDQLPSSSAQPEDTLRLGKNTVSEANNFFDTKKQENTGLESGADPTGMVPKDKYPGINIPLGIFQPKLPSKRKHVSSAQDINAKSDRVEAPVPANTSETPGNKSSRQNFSPFQFIAEEFLPVCLEEMDSNGSVSSELVDNAWDDKEKQIPHSEKGPFEETKTCNMKRALGQTEEDLQSSKKAKRDQHVDAGASQDLEDQAEVDEAGEPPNLSAKSRECPHTSTSSSLESVRADIESTIQRSSQVESQLLTDSICEENLWEKFQSGAITVGEFFTLLQVHVVIQKPRHSQLPASAAVSAPPTAEDLIYSQYIHRPKLRIYEEDCQDLSQKIVELKPHVTVLDQPLVNVIRSLWEVMRTCTDEELSKFGAELNKMKSCFTKEAKILSHNEKETLYRKLLQSAEEQYRKLQSRIEKVDDWMKEAESSMVALESESFWAEEEAGCNAGTAGGQNIQKELQSITAQEEELLRELSEMDAEDELDLAEMEKLKETERACLEILEKYDFTEWELMEWSEQKAVFNFLYDSVTLTVVFGPPVDGKFFAAHPSRSIISLDFESFLDEEQAPPSSCLVQRLIFQFIGSRGSWQDKCPTLCYLPQALLDISLVVNRCKILGEELEFLQRWGAKYHLLEIDIKETEVKLLFSSSVAFAKFELALAVSHDYPSAVLPFRVQTHIGNIGEKEVAAVLSRVPAGHHYLRRAVISIHQNLLQAPR